MVLVVKNLQLQQIIVLFGSVITSIAQDSPVGIFCDLRRAFDCINHEILLNNAHLRLGFRYIWLMVLCSTPVMSYKRKSFG